MARDLELARPRCQVVHHQHNRNKPSLQEIEMCHKQKGPKKETGKSFRSSYLVQKHNLYTTSMGSLDREKDIEDAKQAIPSFVFVVEDSKTGQGRTSGNGILADVVRSNGNFFHPRRLLSQASYPPVDGTLTTFEKVADSVSRLTDPTQVSAIPPQSVLSEIEGELNTNNSSRVCFKIPGYGSEDDMWLPASFFNRAIHFDSTSKFGRKRKHTVDPENAMEGNKRAKRRASYKHATDAAGSEKKEKQTNGKQFKRRKHTKENGEGRPSASKSSVTERNAREVSSETGGDVVEGTTSGTRLRVSKTKVSSGSSSA